MIEEKVIPESNLETIKKRIKFLEAIDPDDVALKLLKQQISINISSTTPGLHFPDHSI